MVGFIGAASTDQPQRALQSTHDELLIYIVACTSPSHRHDSYASSFIAAARRGNIASGERVLRTFIEPHEIVNNRFRRWFLRVRSCMWHDLYLFIAEDLKIVLQVGGLSVRWR